MVKVLHFAGEFENLPAKKYFEVPTNRYYTCIMLSILIPVYNYDLRPLVRDLLVEVPLLSVPVEIILLDDGSELRFREKNRELLTWNGVIYEELPQNVGRARIRNLLAQKARYDYLLFMDADSRVVLPDYLRNYLQHLEVNTVICGGRVYQEQPPADEIFHLHWKVGKNREESTAARRQQKPYLAFMTNNYLLPKSLQLSIPFEERLRQYGHEDTLLGWQLRKAGIRMLHINNPLEHIGLEKDSIFLEKIKKSIQNLLILKKIHPGMQTRLLQVARLARVTGLDRFFLPVFRRKADQWLAQLKQAQPNLLFFDLWKLGVLLEALRQEKTASAGTQAKHFTN